MNQIGLSRKAQRKSRSVYGSGRFVSCAWPTKSPTARAEEGPAPFGTVMKDATGFQTQGAVIFNSAEQRTGTRKQDPRCCGIKHNTPCVQKPVGSVTLTANWPANSKPANILT